MKKPTRIAFISEHASPLALRGGVDAGGQNVYVDEVSRNLVTHGYSVDIFSRREDAAVPEIIEWAPGVRIINVFAGPASYLPKDQTWLFMPAFRDYMLAFMQREELNYELLHGNFWMSGWVACEIGERLHLPVVQIFHAMGKTKKRHQQEADTSPKGRIEVELGLVRRVERIIAQCPSERDELSNDYQADARKIVTIPSAVNTQIFHPIPHAEARQRLDLPQDEFVIAYVGRMLPRKDVRNVVRGLSTLLYNHDTQGKKISLLIVGGETVDPDPVATPEIGELQQLAAELGVTEHIRFVGKRQQDTLYTYYSAADVVVTTPWYEPFGLTPLEGMACARPVIGSAVGGIAFTVVDGETGFLVPPRNPQALATRLLQLVQDPELKECMGQKARQRVEQEFTWPVVAARTAALYEMLLAPSVSAQSLGISAMREIGPRRSPAVSLDDPSCGDR